MQREIFYIHSYAELFLFPFQKTVCQPPAHRFIIEFQTSISKDNGSHESKYHIRDTFHHCSVIVAYPSRISIYQWIMGNINRIGNVSQELAYGSRALTGHLAARKHAFQAVSASRGVTEVIRRKTDTSAGPYPHTAVPSSRPNHPQYRRQEQSDNGIP